MMVYYFDMNNYFKKTLPYICSILFGSLILYGVKELITSHEIQEELVFFLALFLVLGIGYAFLNSRLILPIKRYLLILLGIVLLFLALFNMPTRYYEALRWYIFFISLLYAAKSYELRRGGWMIVLILSAILFNPFFYFHDGRTAWEVRDVIEIIIFGSYLNTFWTRI